jgi:hypothetical protein
LKEEKKHCQNQEKTRILDEETTKILEEEIYKKFEESLNTNEVKSGNAIQELKKEVSFL